MTMVTSYANIKTTLASIMNYNVISGNSLFKFYYSPLPNCRRPTLIQNGPQKGRATLKNVATLIRAKRENFVADA